MTDSQLIRRLRKGDKKSFDELFERYYEQGYNYAAALLEDAAAREDVLQNVFFKLWCGRSRLDPSKSLRSYLMTAIRNEAVSFLRLKYNASRSGNVPDIADDSQDVFDMMQFAETNARLDRIIGRMPPQRREVFELSRKGDMSVKEIAEKMGLSPRTVERHLSLALEYVRSQLS